VTGYIVVAVCNFDDVLVGAYEAGPKGKALALRRARAVALKPSLCFAATHQANDTELLFTRVYRIVGHTRFHQVAEFDLDGDQVEERAAVTRHRVTRRPARTEVEA
jgi:hypothetical protein